jgi:hypothetical protein
VNLIGLSLKTYLPKTGLSFNIYHMSIRTETSPIDAITNRMNNPANREILMTALDCMPEISLVESPDDQLEIISSLEFTGYSRLSEVAPHVDKHTKKLGDTAVRSAFAVNEVFVPQEEVPEEVLARSLFLAAQEANLRGVQYGLIAEDDAHHNMQLLLLLVRPNTFSYDDLYQESKIKGQRRLNYLQRYSDIVYKSYLPGKTKDEYLHSMIKLTTIKVDDPPKLILAQARELDNRVSTNCTRLMNPVRQEMPKVDSHALIRPLGLSSQQNQFFRQFNYDPSIVVKNVDQLIDLSKLSDSNFVGSELSNEAKIYYAVSAYFEKLVQDLEASDLRPAVINQLQKHS